MDGCLEIVAQVVVLALALVGLAALVQRVISRGRGAGAGAKTLETRLAHLEADVAALRRWAWEVHSKERASTPVPAAEMAPQSASGEAAAPPADAGFAVEAAGRAAHPTHAAEPSPPAADALPGGAGPAAPADVPPAAEPASPSPRRPSIEERLGARLPVWIGSIALALAGAFLVKYSLDQGWIGPRVRVLLALAMAFALIAAGERMRRSSASIAQGLTAAGVAVLFAALLASVHLYELLSPLAGFLLMALATAGAVGLSLRHGPMVALIGLLGGLVTPHLVLATEPRPAHLFGYLLLLEGGLLTLGRRRGWRGLALGSLAGGLGWTLAWIAGSADGRGAALFLLATAALSVAAGADPERDPEAGGWRWRGPHAAVSLLGLLGSLALLVVLVAAQDFPTGDWIHLGILSAGLLVLGRLEERFARLPMVAAVLVGLLLTSWLIAGGSGEFGRYVATVAAFGVLFAVGGYAAQWRAPRPGDWAWLSAGAALAATLLVLLAGWRSSRELPEALLCLGVAGAAAAGAAPVLRWRGAGARGSGGYGVSGEAFVGLAVLLLALAPSFDLRDGALTIAWALLVPAMVELARRLRLAAPWWLATALAVVVAVRLLGMPEDHFPAGGWPLANRLLVDYGVPLAAFAVAAWRARRGARVVTEQGPRFAALGTVLTWGAALFAFLLVGLEVRHAFGSGAWEPMFGPFYVSTWDEPGYAEWGALISAWLVLAGGLAWWGRRRGDGEVEGAAMAATVATVALLLLGPVLAANPAWNRTAVGATPVLNLLLVVYGLPALLLGAHTVAAARHGRPWLARLTGNAALVLVFLLVTLEVRQAFHGTYLDGPVTGHAEQYAYSAAWLLLGMALLVAGILRRGGGRPLRLAALAVTTVAVVKVFLYDTAHLSDLYRVLSFLGLGLSLLLLAWLYQRFVFQHAGEHRSPRREGST